MSESESESDLRCFMMNLPPRSDLRVAELVYFFKAMRDAFGLSAWRDCMVGVFELTEEAVENLMQGKWKDKPPVTGGGSILGDPESELPIRLTFSTGSSEYVWDVMKMQFGGDLPVPDVACLRGCIEKCRPAVAELSHFGNESSLHFWERARQLPHKVDHAPVIVHWLHYWTRDIAREFGGLAHCLKTPAFKTEAFCDGVLIQLTPEPLEPDNEEHLAAQRRAMEHLGMPVDFVPEPQKVAFFPRKP